MSTLSTARKLGLAARILGQQAGRNRTVGAVASAARQTARAFGRILHQLWLEVTGAVFLSMAGIGGIAMAKEYSKYEAGRTTAGRVAVTACFTITMAWFGVTSFWRVRRKTRERAQ